MLSLERFWIFSPFFSSVLDSNPLHRSFICVRTIWDTNFCCDVVVVWFGFWMLGFEEFDFLANFGFKGIICETVDESGWISGNVVVEGLKVLKVEDEDLQSLMAFDLENGERKWYNCFSVTFCDLCPMIEFPWLWLWLDLYRWWLWTLDLS
jgi:hypothetical protein